jgi:hypothetical protein
MGSLINLLFKSEMFLKFIERAEIVGRGDFIVAEVFSGSVGNCLCYYNSLGRVFHNYPFTYIF